MARVYAAANQARFTTEIVRQVLLLSPWLVPRLVRIPKALRALTSAETFLESHRQVQGRRLLEPRPHVHPTALSA